MASRKILSHMHPGFLASSNELEVVGGVREDRDTGARCFRKMCSSAIIIPLRKGCRHFARIFTTVDRLETMGESPKGKPSMLATDNPSYTSE